MPIFIDITLILATFESLAYSLHAWYYVSTMNDPFSNPFLIYALFIWSLLWKGLALWRAAKQSQRNWYLAILILNTVGILEIVYLFQFSKTKMTLDELKNGFKDIFISKPKSK